MNLVDWWTDTIEPLMDEDQEHKALETVMETIADGEGSFLFARVAIPPGMILNIYSSEERIPDVDKLMTELATRERFDLTPVLALLTATLQTKDRFAKRPALVERLRASVEPSRVAALLAGLE